MPRKLNFPNLLDNYTGVLADCLSRPGVIISRGRSIHHPHPPSRFQSMSSLLDQTCWSSRALLHISRTAQARQLGPAAPSGYKSSPPLAGQGLPQPGYIVNHQSCWSGGLWEGRVYSQVHIVLQKDFATCSSRKGMPAFDREEWTLLQG